jgi:microcompartment protein CcmK/EutM
MELGAWSIAATAKPKAQGSRLRSEVKRAVGSGNGNSVLACEKGDKARQARNDESKNISFVPLDGFY